MTVTITRPESMPDPSTPTPLTPPADTGPVAVRPALGRVTAERADRSRTTADLLGQAAECTDVAARSALLDRVVVLNMPVARSVARRYHHKGIAAEDLDQVAFMALVRAAAQFDVSLQHDFLSYAVPTIRGELKKHFRDHGWSVRPPRRVQEIQGRIIKARGELTQRLGRSPRPSDLATYLEEDLDAVQEALATDGCFAPTSLDLPVGDDLGATLGELIGTEDASRKAAEARVVLGPVVRRLGERDRLILRKRFFEGCTQQEIADHIGVTQMQVSRLLTRILADLRAALTAQP